MSDRFIPSRGYSIGDLTVAFDAYRSHAPTLVRSRTPSRTYRTLTEFLSQRPIRNLDYGLLLDGLSRLKERIVAVGGEAIPRERCLIAIGDSDSSSFGGFHTSGQGYFHLEQVSVGSVCSFGTEPDLSPTLLARELLRSIAHDTVHHSSHRTYRVDPVFAGSLAQLPEAVYRWQYGVNFRRRDGTSYSARDRADAGSTRNLGILMDAVTDQFATRFVREITDQQGTTTVNAPTTLSELIERDITGMFGEADLAALKGMVPSAGDQAVAYLESTRRFQWYVVRRWTGFCHDLLLDADGPIYSELLSAIITGRLRGLCSLLNTATGLSSGFRTLFLQEKYSTSPCRWRAEVRAEVNT